MFQYVDLNKNKNLFVASVIFITGVGGMVISFCKVEIRTVACALILGILTNLLLSGEKDDEKNSNCQGKAFPWPALRCGPPLPAGQSRCFSAPQRPHGHCF
ncbi:MAG: hypothetical protein IJJ71_14830 [Treponema sp.]|nr:hypothetical protein [Treponema sp.]MBR0101487.1 hypothetical protein [Treponema sp.]MBR0497430.1 hypothetical protein [Treponema sp.]